MWNPGHAGSNPDVTRHHRPLLAAPAAAALLLLAGCGDDPPEGDAAPSSPAAAVESTIAPEGQSGSDQQADVSFEDQSGDGSSVVVDTVSSPQGGFVVITIDEDGGQDGAVVGSAQVQVGTSDDVEVTLDPPLTQDTDLTATLYADTDNDGTFEQGTDELVPDPEDGDGNDDGGDGDRDAVEDGAEYRIG